MVGTRGMLDKNRPEPLLGVALFVFIFILGNFLPVTAFGNQSAMKHSPPDYFICDHRLQLDLSVSDPEGIEHVRCYFKAASEADFVFVPMTNTGGDGHYQFYSCVLPAPSSVTLKIEYLFLVVDGINDIVKSQIFALEKERTEEVPAWQNIASEKDIQVSMELDQVPSELPGFSDNIVMNKVESGLRFGVVAGGLYALTAGKTATTGGVAATATSSGTVTAGTAGAGFSTAAIVGASVAGAAAVGGTAAAVSSGGGGGGGGDGGGGGGGGGTSACGTKTQNGGDEPETHTYNMGQTSGTFRFEWEAQNLKDRFKVYYQGSKKFDTGCISGNGSTYISYSGSSSQITVTVEPNCTGGSGTWWEYTVYCP